MDIQIRKAKKEELAFSQERLKKYVLDSTNIDWEQFFVARLKDKNVAFGRIIDYADSFEIASLGVDYYHRKKSIGKIMLTYLVEKAKRKDSRKPIYGVTHIEHFLAACGFIEVKDNYPDYLDYKRKYICRLDESNFKVMKWSG